MYRLPTIACLLGRVFAVTLLANLAFFGLVLAAQSEPSTMAARIRTAFQSGDLGIKDYLPFDRRRGWHQYNDCTVLQMISNQDPSRLARALAPRIYYQNADWTNQCAVLRSLTVDGLDPNRLFMMRYARYWHGNNVVAALALHGMELASLRRMFSIAVWMAIALLALAAGRTGAYVRRVGFTISLVAATLWAVPYFGPGLTHAPGDALLLLGLAMLAAWPRSTVDLCAIVLYAAAFGAAVVFFEMMTGQLLIAAAWLGTLTLAAGRDRGHTASIAAPGLAIAAMVAFGLAALGTGISKQILAIIFVEPHAGAAFLSQLGLYMGLPEQGTTKLGIASPFVRLAHESKMLTFGHSTLGYGVIAATALAWLLAAVLGWTERRTQHGGDVLSLVILALALAAWVVLLPNLTYIHATFIVRILVVPISLALLALCWPRGVPHPGDQDPPALQVLARRAPSNATSRD
jgi:hypothetical protein